ncbi:MAG: hypothetical protein JKY61_11070 [Planctomycetes bacterium]|nr:hypothetical protein [Planctomycetota bacterium]
MKSLHSLALCAIALVGHAFGQNNVLVIESQSYQPGHTMDDQWEMLATSAGYNVTTGTQATLLNTNFYNATDVLVVASGLIALPPAARNAIEGFLVQGGNVYLQGEYLVSYETNQLFADLISLNGGTFNWQTTLSGSLAPVTVQPPFDAPGIVATLDSFWYGATGAGSGVTPVLIDPSGNGIGWIYTFPSGGRLTCNTDQDWVKTAFPARLVLMGNMLEWLMAGTGGGGLGTVFCSPGLNNSTGSAGMMGLSGSAAVVDNDLSLQATQLPNGQFAVFLASRTQVSPVTPVASMGFLCLGGNVAILNRAGEFGAVSGGQRSLQLPMNDIPELPGMNVPVMSGESWYFQCWHRDMVSGSSTSNFTDGISLTFL